MFFSLSPVLQQSKERVRAVSSFMPTREGAAGAGMANAGAPSVAVNADVNPNPPPMRNTARREKRICNSRSG
jgi:hypothetical protein